MKDGQILPRKKVTSREYLYKFSEMNEVLGTYIYVPLSSEGKIYGYAIIANYIDVAFDNLLYSWTRHMIQNLEHFRRNVIISELNKKLKKMSLTDPLTGIYNRGACEELVYPMLQQGMLDQIDGVVMIADIDCMKSVNDLYGHANGDMALKMVVDALVDGVPEDFIITRFGGDEFLIGGLLNQELDMNQVVQNIYDSLDKKVRENEIPFELAISVGYSIIHPEDEFDIEKTVREADESMYVIKKSHHENDKVCK